VLRELSITNFALIGELRAEFGAGLNVLTGETGAGKSMLIDALGLALGTRGEAEQIRTGAAEARVEAAFDLEGDGGRRLLAEWGAECPPDEFLAVRRHLLREGKSKAYLNGRLSSVAALRALAEHLVELHGQHQGAALTQPSRQRLLLDAYAGLSEEVSSFRGLFHRRQVLRDELGALQAGGREQARRLDLLEHQRAEIAAARLSEGEEERLVHERAILTHAERLHAAAHLGYEGLYGEEGSVSGRVSGILSRLREARKIDPRFGGAVEACESALAAATDAAEQLRDYRESVAFDPERLEQVEARLHEIARLKRKYGASIAEILEVAAAAERELRDLMTSEERAQQVERELREVETSLQERAARLTAGREAAARRLAEAVRDELRALRMDRAAFEVAVRPRRDAEGLRLDASGADDVEFLIAANPGEDLKPLSRTASGGELSRVMLAIKAILAVSDDVPTLIFDEVDVGIGGGMAEVVGQKLWSVARRRQVISITHLPQIAALADRHLAISKQITGGRADMVVRALDGEERVREIARMLGAKGRSGTPVHHAQEILDAARRWKAARRVPEEHRAAPR
jgi:DNA repair protein RecN (Recombination protein N)